jgi:hypothetical protein
MAEYENNDARSADKIEFLVKEIIKLNLKIKDLENTKEDNDKKTKVYVNNILTELKKTTIDWDTLPIVLY